MNTTLSHDESLRNKLLSTAMPSVMGELIATQCRGFITHAAGATSDGEQQSRLQKLQKDVAILTPADIQSHPTKWLNVLEDLASLRTKGHQSNITRIDCFDVLAVKMAAVGAIDENFERRWNAKEFGRNDDLDFRFENFMKANNMMREFIKRSQTANLSAPL
jgi:hypothetical protein